LLGVKRLGINLKFVGRLGQSVGGGVKVADAAFIDVLPLQQNKIAKRVNKYRYGGKQRFV
jgi:hypothetical protein